MSVEIDPLELSFRKPFTSEVSEVLRIRNPNSSPVAFKVKTTAPKQYCVRPNSGRIEPGRDVEVAVSLQAMKQDPPADTRCRDKFLVQSVLITSDKEFANIVSILETADKSSVIERKIRVNWLAADSTSDSIPAAVTPNRRSVATNNLDTPDVSHHFSSPGDDSSTLNQPSFTEKSADRGDSKITQQAASTYEAVTNTVKEAATTATEEIKAKTSQAEVQVRSAAVSAGLRNRDNKSGEKPPVLQAADNVRQSVENTTGVSVQLVAVMCLISFLLAYFFF